jgi:hypothetical protein
MKKIVVTIALLAASSAYAHTARVAHHGSKKPAHQAMHAEHHVVRKVKEAPADAPPSASPSQTLPYDAFRA